MEKILAFLANNWQYIGIVLVCIVDIILLLFRRNKVIDNSLTKEIYDLLLKAENIYGSGNGEQKMSYVLANFDFYLHPDVKIGLVKAIVEYLLTGPTKKGGFGREETE